MRFLRVKIFDEMRPVGGGWGGLSAASLEPFDLQAESRWPVYCARVHPNGGFNSINVLLAQHM